MVDFTSSYLLSLSNSCSEIFCRHWAILLASYLYTEYTVESTNPCSFLSKKKNVVTIRVSITIFTERNNRTIKTNPNYKITEIAISNPPIEGEKENYK